MMIANKTTRMTMTMEKTKMGETSECAMEEEEEKKRS